ncbi:MAG TPA: fibronectin type III domain-containing protein, partial [Elusimicrobiales bacterium]|nr:fibronectin type III domain-containing protein [Elusimicrobiales bacterium]
MNHGGVVTAYTESRGTATWANAPLSAVSTFTSVGVSGFKAAWNANANPLPGTVYTVQVSTASDFNPGVTDQASASTAPAAGPSYTFTGLTLSTTYYFQVRAANHNGIHTAYVPLGSTRTLSLSSPAPGAVTAASTVSLTAAWQLTPGATGYTLAASVNPGQSPSPVAASSSTLGGLQAVLEGLVPNTTYHLFVRANGYRESSDWAAYPATSTLANPPASAASTFSAVTYDGFSVHWDNNGNPLGTTLYIVEVSTAYNFDPGATNGVSFATAPASGPSAAFTSLNPNTYYYFRVRAMHNSGGFSDWTNLGYRRTLAFPVLHSAGDGVLLYGQAGNSSPRFRNYYKTGNNFGSAEETVSGVPGSLFVIKTSPLDSVQEAVAGYVRDGVLHVLWTDGANWSEEWNHTVGGNELTRRFDIAYETATGDVMVLYSNNAASNNELGYRTKSGSSACGSGNWSAENTLSAARTDGIVQWVKMASDRRAEYGDIAAIWADANSDLSAMVWNGSAWENEPSAALDTSLEVITSPQDVEDFDVEYESISGDIMAVWANSAGGAGTNGV